MSDSTTFPADLDKLFARCLADLSHPEPDRRVAAVDAIGQWTAEYEDDGRVEGAVPRIAAALEDPHRDVRWSAAYALGAIASPAGVAPLKTAYDRAGAAGDAGLQLVIVKALGKIAREPASLCVQPPLIPEAVDLLRRVSTLAPSHCLRTAAARGLARAGAAP